MFQLNEINKKNHLHQHTYKFDDVARNTKWMPPILCWFTVDQALEASSKLGGSDLTPFLGLLEGGVEGELFGDLEDYFYYAMLLSQGMSLPFFPLFVEMEECFDNTKKRICLFCEVLLSHISPFYPFRPS